LRGSAGATATHSACVTDTFGQIPARGHALHRIACACVLLTAFALTGAGCASGYVTYYEPTLAGAAKLPHADAYMRPPPPAGVELAGGTLAVGCTNIRKFILLPIPWFRRGFRPPEYEIQLTFRGEPSEAVIDTTAVTLRMDGKTIAPSKVSYQGERPAPTYVETIVLPTLNRYRLEAPRVVTFSFRTDAREAKKFQLTLGEVTVDGARTLVPPIAFSREGQFVAYRFAKKKKKATADDVF
jgi:rRNA maturation protein Nop10